MDKKRIVSEDESKKVTQVEKQIRRTLRPMRPCELDDLFPRELPPADQEILEAILEKHAFVVC